MTFVGYRKHTCLFDCKFKYESEKYRVKSFSLQHRKFCIYFFPCPAVASKKKFSLHFPHEITNKKKKVKKKSFFRLKKIFFSLKFLAKKHLVFTPSWRGKKCRDPRQVRFNGQGSFAKRYNPSYPNKFPNKQLFFPLSPKKEQKKVFFGQKIFFFSNF